MITIVSDPGDDQTCQDDLWHVASSDNSAGTDFKFVWDVWINGVQKIRVKTLPNPDDNLGYFDAGPTVRNSITYDWFAPTSAVFMYSPAISGEVGIDYEIRIGEDVSGLTTTNMASGDIQTYNYVAPLFKRKQVSIADRLNNWLSNRPMTAKVYFFGQDTTDLIGDVLTIYPACNPIYTPVLLHFMNAWGMFETVRFDLLQRLNMEVERKSFTKRDYRQNSGVTFYNGNSVYHEGKINYHNKKNWKLKVTADALTDAEYEWLYELISSPKILMEKDGNYYPVTITETNYEYSTFVNNRLRPLEIELELNQTRYSQLR